MLLGDDNGQHRRIAGKVDDVDIFLAHRGNNLRGCREGRICLRRGQCDTRASHLQPQSDIQRTRCRSQTWCIGFIHHEAATSLVDREEIELDTHRVEVLEQCTSLTTGSLDVALDDVGEACA